MSTAQEDFWRGDFGNSYISRNNDKELLASKSAMFTKILSKTNNLNSVVEFGCNIGLNLLALKNLLPYTKLTGIEINHKAANEAKKMEIAEIHEQSIFEFSSSNTFDLTFTSGVLIHINPSRLYEVYEKLYEFSKKYIVIAEYYNPSPVTVEYRNHQDVLFKRDFASELMAKYKDLVLLNYGFVYHKDATFPLDDITWFLFEKK